MIILTFAKSTKNFHKFDAQTPLLGSIYIPRELMETPPSEIRIPVDDTEVASVL